MRKAIGTALIAFVLSRIIVFAAVLSPTLVHPDAAQPADTDRVLIRFDAAVVTATLKQLATSHDAGWYQQIVLHGYEARPFDASAQANWAFFPLHPMLWRGGIALSDSIALSGMLFAHVAMFAALVLLFLLVRTLGRSEAVATRAVYVLALFPVSYFLSFPWTESLFLALTIGCAYAAQRRAWLWVAVLGGLASATRLAAVFLVPALLANLLRQPSAGNERRHPEPCALLALACIPLGLIAFMAFLFYLTGNAFAFSDVQAAWGRTFGLPLRSIGIVLLRPWEIAADWNLRPLNLAAVLLAVAAVWHFIRRREWHFAVFIALGIAAPLLTGNITSMSRYALGLFPIMIALADWGKHRGFERIWFALSVAILALMSAAFGMGMTFAGT